MKIQRRFFLQFLKTLSLIGLFSSIGSAHPVEDHYFGGVPTLKTTRIPISRTIRGGEMGLTDEAIPGLTLRKYELQAREYLKVRRAGPNSREKYLWIEKCASSEKESNPYCQFYTAKKNAAAKKDLFADTERASASHVAMALVGGNIKELSQFKEGALHRGLRLYSNWSSLSSLADKVVDHSGCASQALYLSLGMKGEEYFPDATVRKAVKQLYTRAAECKSDDPIRDKSVYRLSLLQIWDGECSKAEPHLQELLTKRSSEFLSRAMFWKATCSDIRKDPIQTTMMRTRLEDDFPMSYHNLLLNRNSSSKVWASIETEPSLQFRTDKKKELNTYITAAEVLVGIGGKDAAIDILNFMQDQLDDTETEFRLYIAALYEHLGDRIGNFKTLAALFRGDATSITKGALELFYPLKRFDVIQSHSNMVDPILVASLIRQESGFNEHARSPAGAMGLMQLMPQTARTLEHVSKRELFDAKTNVRLGVKFFAKLLKKYDNDAELALAAYNAGGVKVDEWLKRYPTANRILFLDLIPFQETRDYVALIARNYYWYTSLYSDRLITKKKKTGAYFSMGTTQ